MIVIANQDLPTLGVVKDQSFNVAPLRAKALRAQGMIRLPPSIYPPAAQAGDVPAPLPGSRTGGRARASSSAPGPAPSKPNSRKRKAAPKS